MGLRDIESALPPGFRFHPSDEELVYHYLHRKVANVKVYEGTMIEVDLHIHEPWELPEGAKLSNNEWYFFSFRDRKYATGSRTNRATKSGYWKATGKDRTIYHPQMHGIFGMRKTLVFYSGRAPNGIKTAWVMHEFRLENPHMPPKEDWVLCRVFNKGKGEGLGSNSSLEESNGHDRRNKPGSSHLESPPPLMVDQSMPGGCFETMGAPHDLTLAAFPCNNFLDFPHELDTASMMGMGMMGMGSEGNVVDGGDDELYGFLLDVGSIDDDEEEDGAHGHVTGIKGNIVGRVEDVRF